MLLSTCSLERKNNVRFLESSNKLLNVTTRVNVYSFNKVLYAT